MYEENRRFSWTNLFIKIIIVIIFILFTIWLLSLSTKGMSNSLNVLTDQVFSENIDKMKEVGKSYFTTERLPKNVGDVKTLTLQKMYDNKLLLELKDKNGKKCSADNSYVSIEKLEKEYQMKVYLECGKEKDYVITIMGCYNYCDTDICEKKEEAKVLEYEYSKTTGGAWGPWGSWSEWSTGYVSKTNYREVETKIVNETYTYDKPVTETKYVGEATCQTLSGYALVSNKEGVCTYSKTEIDEQSSVCPTVDGYTLESQQGFNCGYRKNNTETKNPSCPTVDGYDNTGRSGFTCNYSKSNTITTDPSCPTLDGYDKPVRNGLTCSYSKSNTVKTDPSCPTLDGYGKPVRNGLTCSYSKSNTVKTDPSCPTLDGYDKPVRNGFTCSYSKTTTSKTEYDLVYYKTGSGNYIPADNATYHYQQTSADYRYACNPGCVGEWYYTYTIYTKKYKTTTVTTTKDATCPSGYTKSNGTCVKTTTSTITKDATCPSGYTKSNNTCVKTTTSTTTKDATCPSGYTKSNNTCAKTTTSLTTKNATCPSGYVKSGNTCAKYVTTTKTAECPNGYTRENNTCTKEVTKKTTKNAVCSTGYIKGGKCYKDETTYVKETGTKSVTYYRYRTRSYSGGTTDYKWSLSNDDKDLINAGYRLTGKTREVKGGK